MKELVRCSTMSRQDTHPPAFSHFRATNHSRDAEYVIRDSAGEVIAAKWRRPASRNPVPSGLAQHTLMYLAGGSTSVAKFVAGRCLGTRIQHGSVAFLPKDEPSEWIRGGVCEVMHIYLSPAVIQQCATESCNSPAPPEIDPLFGIHDPWLQSYFTMLQSQFETYRRSEQGPDALFLTQSLELLIRHLVCWHSNLSDNGKRRALAHTAGSSPLGPPHLARVLAYIDANIKGDIALTDLAQLVGVSKFNFIRSFRAATQRTPYAYLVTKRLARAVVALRSSTMSVEQIAHHAGFKSTPGFSNVFKKHYGMSPRDFRARSQYAISATPSGELAMPSSSEL